MNTKTKHNIKKKRPIEITQQPRKLVLNGDRWAMLHFPSPPNEHERPEARLTR